MNPFTKLQNLNKFLKTLAIHDLNCSTHFTTANADTTSRLDKELGDQLVLARPEMDGADPTDSTISTVFYHLKNATEDGCHLLAGLEISRYSVTPETSIFGSWVGWSVEIVFE